MGGCASSRGSIGRLSCKRWWARCCISRGGAQVGSCGRRRWRTLSRYLIDQKSMRVFKRAIKSYGFAPTRVCGAGEGLQMDPADRYCTGTNTGTATVEPSLINKSRRNGSASAPVFRPPFVWEGEDMNDRTVIKRLGGYVDLLKIRRRMLAVFNKPARPHRPSLPSSVV